MTRLGPSKKYVLIIEAAFCLTIIYSLLYSDSCLSSCGMKGYSTKGGDCPKGWLERLNGGKENPGIAGLNCLCCPEDSLQQGYPCKAE